jgi:hypothetical protein
MYIYVVNAILLGELMKIHNLFIFIYTKICNFLLFLFFILNKIEIILFKSIFS